MPTFPMNNSLRLTTDYVSTRSISLVICDRAGNATTGAAICIEVGSHWLLATAGHSIAGMNDDRLQLIPAGELSALPVPFASRSCSPDHPAPATDVAWIELERRVAGDHGLHFLKLSDLKPKQTFDSDHPFLVHGYSHQTAFLSTPEADLESIIGLTMIAVPEGLPRAVESHEIALEYPPRDEQGRPIAMASAAFRFSGGGVWRSHRHDESRIENPERLQLVAINARWDRNSAILFATKIEYWLDLVRQDFPDARDEINKLLQS
jgi:hypothetical protein